VSAPPAVQASLIQVQARLASIQARLGAVPSRATGGSATTGTSSFDGVLSAMRTGGALVLGSSTGGPPSAAALRTAAQEYVGIPYVWGGTDPATGLDCSGFTQHLMRRFGVELPRVSADQLRTGAPVADLEAARPGDLLGWDNGPRNVGADHVAVYLGNGLMAEAPGTGGQVQIVAVDRTPDYIRRVVPASARLSEVAGSTAGGLPTTTPFAELFTSAGARHGVDPKLLALMAERESGFDPTAVSPAGAQGLMQLMPGTARGLGVADPFDPAEAIDGAARLMRTNLDTFGSVDKALAAYNAGAGNVRRYGGVPPFAETQAYVAWIGARYGGTGAWS
jgi:cell wall-associated NlpC family hydrolase